MQKLVLHRRANTLVVDDAPQYFIEFEVTNPVDMVVFRLKISNHQLFWKGDGFDNMLLFFNDSGPRIKHENVVEIIESDIGFAFVVDAEDCLDWLLIFFEDVVDLLCEQLVVSEILDMLFGR